MSFTDKILAEHGVSPNLTVTSLLIDKGLKKLLQEQSEKEGIKFSELIDKIAKRDGFGDLLAEGVKRLSEKIGKESEKFAMHCKGQEFAAFDPRAVVGMGLVYATATPGANHSYGPTLRAELGELRDPFSFKEKGRVCRSVQNQYCLEDSMIFCSLVNKIEVSKLHQQVELNHPSLLFRNTDFCWYVAERLHCQGPGC